MQHFYTRLFLSQFFFAIVLILAPKDVKATAQYSPPRRQVYDMNEAIEIENELELPPGLTVDNLPVYTKCVSEMEFYRTYYYGYGSN